VGRIDLQAAAEAVLRLVGFFLGGIDKRQIEISVGFVAGLGELLVSRFVLAHVTQRQTQVVSGPEMRRRDFHRTGKHFGGRRELALQK
jgi:hypothetical protein